MFRPCHCQKGVTDVSRGRSVQGCSLRTASNEDGIPVGVGERKYRLWGRIKDAYEYIVRNVLQVNLQRINTLKHRVQSRETGNSGLLHPCHPCSNLYQVHM